MNVNRIIICDECPAALTCVPAPVIYQRSHTCVCCCRRLLKRLRAGGEMHRRQQIAFSELESSRIGTDCFEVIYS